MSVDVVVTATAFMDLTFIGLEALPSTGEERFAGDLLRSPGGGAINAIGVARLGLRAALAAPLGRDLEGDFIRDALTDEGILLLTSDAARTPTTVVMPHGGERAMVTYEPGTTTRASDVAAFDPRAVVVSLNQLDVVPDGVPAYTTCGDDDARAFARRPPRRPRQRAGAVREPPRVAAADRARTRPRRARRGSGECCEIAIVTCGPDGAVACVDGRAPARARLPDAGRRHDRRRRPAVRGVRVGRPHGRRPADRADLGRAVRGAVGHRADRGRRRGDARPPDRGGHQAGAAAARGKGDDRMRIHRVAALAAVIALAGCGTPGGDSDDNAEKTRESNADAAKVDVAKAGDVTLTVWDQEVRGGQAKQIKRLNESFQAKYPNVTIKRVAKSFTDLNTTLKLAVSGPKAPDVVQANQGRPVMGQLVKGGLLRPMDAYADAYGWADRWSKTLLDLNRFSPDGKQFGTGNLFGVSQMGEIVGVYYNKDKVASVPKTFAEFEQMVAQAKQDGEVPISFGNLDKYGGIHEFQTVQNQYVDKQAVRDFVFAREGATFATAENEEAASKLQEWAEKGYFTPDYNGTGYDQAWPQFAKGRGPFLIGGTWLTSDLVDAMGDKLGFFLMPRPEEGGEPVSLGGESLPWGDHREARRTRTWPPPTSTTSRTPRRRRCWWRRTTCRR